METLVRIVAAAALLFMAGTGWRQLAEAVRKRPGFRTYDVLLVPAIIIGPIMAIVLLVAW